MFALRNALFFLSALACVSAHGYMPSISIAGKEYKGNGVGKTDLDSVIRSVTAQDPMKGADNKDLACGPGSAPAKLTADANAGDELEFAWEGAAGNTWIHKVGPMITYMALCGDGTEDCADVDSSKAKWFKIDEQGMTADDVWAQEVLYEGNKAKVSLPSDLASGNYLISHEIIALHNAVSVGGAEFYAGCAQLSVKGSGTAAPSDSELVSLPGAYTDNDPGIVTPTIFDMKKTDYQFPGPDVSKLASSGGSGSGDEGDDSSSSSSVKPTSTKTATSSSESAVATPKSGVSTNTGSCKLKKRSKSSSAMKKRGTYHPKRHSRIMRDIVSSFHL